MVLRKKVTSKLGSLAENYATEFIRAKGYKIVERNFRSKFGEIDIIATLNDVLVFIEVKARWSKKFGSPEEAVTPRKLYKIKRTGEYYCLIHPGLPIKLRIDVVALEITNGQVVTSRIVNVD